MVNIGNNEQAMIADVRSCDRIIWDSRDLVGRIWENRVKPHVEADIGVIENNALVTGLGPFKRKETAVVTRLNERMRFLRYGPGEYFKEHCDGQYRTPDGSEFSLYTLHLYLNERDAGNELKGGATVFFDPRWEGREGRIKPKVGRVLVFQHRGLVHSGEEVIGGLKLTMRTDIMYRNETAEERVERVGKGNGEKFEREMAARTDLQCPVCGRKKVQASTTATRNAEQVKTFCQCVECGKKWVIDGGAPIDKD